MENELKEAATTIKKMPFFRTNVSNRGCGQSTSNFARSIQSALDRFHDMSK